METQGWALIQYGEKRTFVGPRCKDCSGTFNQVRVLRHTTCGTEDSARNVRSGS
ncbi:MAG: hypothetical protein DME81_07790 [Verrucomicrobia bacterium]|nr:MAG: hypothetical protein DME81_07790 [Verrucomicrobiota bacterium]